jgi:hypothetical protein
MHQFGWLPTDKIVSYAPCHSDEFIFDPKENCMHLKSLSDIDIDNDIAIDADTIAATIVEFMDSNTTNMGYDWHLFANSTNHNHYEHIPNWTTDTGRQTCQTCNYSFDESALSEYAKKFNLTFCGN